MKKWLLALAILALSTSPAHAQFFGGVVTDPVTHIKQVMQLKEMYKQTVALYDQVRQQYQQYQLMKDQVQTWGNLSMYRHRFASWDALRALDRYGNIGDLSRSANNGAGVQGAYEKATVPLVMRDLNSMPESAARRLRTKYGDSELADASNVSAWELIGRVRQASANSQQALGSLLNDSMNPSSTTLQTQQKAAASGALAVQYLSVLQQLQAAQLEQEALAAQQRRNAQAQALEIDAAMARAPSVAKDVQRGGLANGVYVPDFLQ